jgi:hypothetical protein
MADVDIAVGVGEGRGDEDSTHGFLGHGELAR